MNINFCTLESKQDEELIQKASGIEIPIIVQMTIDSLQLEFWQPEYVYFTLFYIFCKLLKYDNFNTRCNKKSIPTLHKYFYDFIYCLSGVIADFQMYFCFRIIHYKYINI
jgi:hypothetical protein